VLESILLAAAGWAIVTYLGGGYVVPAITGLVVGLVLRPNILRLLGFVFPLLASVIGATVAGFMVGGFASALPGAITGIILFAGYLVGSLLRLVLVPFRWMGKLLGLFRKK